MSKQVAESSLAKRYGVGEWFGHPIRSLTEKQRKNFSLASANKKTNKSCPFRVDANPGALCNKVGGVCSLVTYEKKSSGEVVVDSAENLVVTCPSRFWAGNEIFKTIGIDLLDSKTPTIVKEVGFLESLNSESDREVGRIDTVLVGDKSGTDNWCAIEIQAVYFSGNSMAPEFKNLGEAVGGLPFPEGKRRPDFRSSGPKRLMPQLQIKVPTLRRWGKKMAVIVDKPFFDSLGKMKQESDISNADIVWYVLGFSSVDNKMLIKHRVFTTLESSVEALTAGQAVTKKQFEQEISQCLADPKAITKGKVIKVL
ncbi:MAG: hypothetical protein K2W84_10180 [Burkholderiales bacterium]|nr:hypothetical protein [Burkholderiales bacterium]